MLEHLGPPDRINESVARFIEWRKATGLSPIRDSQTFGIAHDDPKLAAPESFRFDVAGSVPEAVPDNDHGVINKIIPAGRCAVVRHYGSHESIGDGVYYLLRGSVEPVSDP